MRASLGGGLLALALVAGAPSAGATVMISSIDRSLTATTPAETDGAVNMATGLFDETRDAVGPVVGVFMDELRAEASQTSSIATMA